MPRLGASSLRWRLLALFFCAFDVLFVCVENLSAVLDDELLRIRPENLPAPLHRDLAAYAEVLARETGQPAADPVRLIVPMLERFIATDRGFAKARRAAS